MLIAWLWLAKLKPLASKPDSQVSQLASSSSCHTCRLPCYTVQFTWIAQNIFVLVFNCSYLNKFLMDLHSVLFLRHLFLRDFTLTRLFLQRKFLFLREFHFLHVYIFLRLIIFEYNTDKSQQKNFTLCASIIANLVIIRVFI